MSMYALQLAAIALGLVFPYRQSKKIMSAIRGFAASSILLVRLTTQLKKNSTSKKKKKYKNIDSNFLIQSSPLFFKKS